MLSAITRPALSIDIDLVITIPQYPSIYKVASVHFGTAERDTYPASDTYPVIPIPDIHLKYIVKYLF
jgi:hypothetical protein